MQLPDGQNEIPLNYYCGFEIELDEDMLYTIEADRFKTYLDGQKLDENIEFQSHGIESLYVSNTDFRKSLFDESQICSTDPNS